LFERLKQFDFVELISSPDDICTKLRGIKTKIEIQNAAEIHKIEGAAIVRLLHWLDDTIFSKTSDPEGNGDKQGSSEQHASELNLPQQRASELNLPQQRVSEQRISEKLDALRGESARYVSASFPSIVAFGEHSAIVHYSNLSSTEMSPTGNEELRWMLMDVGAHYLGGTTDMTRTVFLNKKEPNAEERNAYTTVLRGHIALATAVFPNGTTGQQLDALARQFLWANQQDYSHGTGHGVGNCLAVHEGPHAISKHNNVSLVPGMIVSNEPGNYSKAQINSQAVDSETKQNGEATRFGVRLENLMVVEHVENGFLSQPSESKFLEEDTDASKAVDADSVGANAVNTEAADAEAVSADAIVAADATTATATNVVAAPTADAAPVATSAITFAIIGRPNTGKSTLINAILNRDAQLVSPIAGVTRDTVDFDFEYAGRQLKMLDTAGVRRRAKIDDVLEKMSVGKAFEALRSAQVCVLMADATELEQSDYGELLQQDITLARRAFDEGRGVVIVLNKIDLIKNRSAFTERVAFEINRIISNVPEVPIVYLSAIKKRGIGRLLKEVVVVCEAWERRVSTGRLNAWLREFAAKHPIPSSSRFRAKMKYITQTHSRPPSFVVFCSRASEIPVSFQRFFTGQLQKAWGLEKVAIRVFFRQQENPFN
jgi:ribosome-associated GTPase EngA